MEPVERPLELAPTRLAPRQERPRRTRQRREARALRWPGDALNQSRRHGRGVTLEGSRKVHGRLKILGLAQLHVDLDVLRKAAHKQLCFLERRQVAGMAQHRIEVFGILLDCSQEGKLGELGQVGAMNRQPKAKIAELLEVLPARHALVLFQRIIPSLCRADQMVGGEPDAVQSEGALPRKNYSQWLSQFRASSEPS